MGRVSLRVLIDFVGLLWKVQKSYKVLLGPEAGSQNLGVSIAAWSFKVWAVNFRSSVFLCMGFNCSFWIYLDYCKVS